MSLENLIERFLWAKKAEQRISENSFKSYFYDLKVFSNFIDQSKLKLEDEKLLEEFSFFLTNNNHGWASMIRKINLIISFLKFCKDEHGIEIKLKSKVPFKQQKHYRTFIENEDFEKIRKFLLEENKQNIRLSYIIETLYSTGMRISEFLSLKFQDIDLIYKNQSLLIKGKGGYERMVFFNEKAIQALKKYEIYINKDKKYIINLTRQRVFQLLKNLGKTLNLDLEKIFLHSFRHRVLTNLVKNGMDLITVQKIAGHRQISTTEKYTHVEDYLYEEILKYHPIINFFKNLKC